MITTKKRKLILLMGSAALLMLVPFIAVLRAREMSDNEAFVFIFIAIVLIFVVISQILQIRQNIYRYFNRIEHSIECAKCFTLFNSPEPVVITDKGGKIVWYNQSFYTEISNGSDAYGINICEELNINPELLKDKNIFLVECSDIKYTTKCTVNTDYGIQMNILYFRDDSDYLALFEEYNNKKPTVAIIAVDNYEDIFRNVRESERARALASMEKIFENLTVNSHSIIKRLAKDRFLVIFEEQHIREVIKERFHILDEARAISVTDDVYITLSIGVGHCSSSLSESEKFAVQALDMAIGRGGDQAAVKTENGFEFFGGLSKGVEKHSRIKTRMIASAMQKIIDNSSNVLIMGHRFGDLDSIGSAIGMSAAVKQMGKDVCIIVDPVKNLANNLINRVQNNHDVCTFINENDALELVDENTLLIIVDTHKSAMLESQAVFENCKNFIIIDHHRKNIGYIENALLFYHEPYASSAAEMISEVIPYFRNINKIPACAADALLSGIALDTKNFIIKTSVRTFESAAYLKKMGADTVSVRSLFANSIEVYHLKSQIVSSAEITENFAVATAEVTDDISGSIRIVAPQACDELLSITGVIAAFVIFRTGDVINISARSYGAVNVQVIMEKIKGGGHLTMAATQLKDITEEEAKNLLYNAIKDYKSENGIENKS